MYIFSSEREKILFSHYYSDNWIIQSSAKVKLMENRKCQNMYKTIPFILFSFAFAFCMHGFPLLAIILGSQILRITTCHVSKFLWAHVNIMFV